MSENSNGYTFRQFSHHFDIITWKHFLIVISISRLYNVFRIIIANKSSRCLKGACTTMKENKLLSYISMLTPEQINKVIDRLPQLYEEVSKQAPVCSPGQTSQSQ